MGMGTGSQEEENVSGLTVWKAVTSGKKGGAGRFRFREPKGHIYVSSLHIT